jgi:glucose-6-phosphate 1-dehydrogenase
LISTPDTSGAGHPVRAPSVSVPGQRACCQRCANPGSAAFPFTRRRGPVQPAGEAWEAFQRRLSFAVADAAHTFSLVEAIAAAERQVGGSPGRLFHLAIPPAAFVPTVTMLGTAGLARGSPVIIEKPFGTDLASARALNQTVHAVFDESHVFRIDHFLGKESVDNILALRFANGLFEPVWNRNHIAYVQIDVPETLSIGGRGGFYDQPGRPQETKT